MSPLPPNEVNDHILNAIKVGVWSGFYTPDEVHQIIDDLQEDGADETMLRAAVAPEFEKKAEAEKAWPPVTDCDRLDSVFERLTTRGILCLHNAGYTMSDGHEDANEALSNQPENAYFGYCFYHGQDLERAVNGEGLMLAYDHVEGDVPGKSLVGLVIKEELEIAGFSLEWDGTSNKRINIPQMDWKRRQKTDAPVTPPVMELGPEPKSFWRRLYLRWVSYS